ncbi:MAG: translation initiation factor [Armatimonadota bacterium]|nr:translation initiation factor [Armatimonadota bacterium]
MGLLDMLFNQVSQTIQNHSSPNTPGPVYDPTDLLGQLSGIFGQHAAERGEDFSGEVRPASEDPYGDPADQQFGNVLPASQDPYGDPADQENAR